MLAKPAKSGLADESGTKSDALGHLVKNLPRYSRGWFRFSAVPRRHAPRVAEFRHEEEASCWTASSMGKIRSAWAAEPVGGVGLELFYLRQ